MTASKQWTFWCDDSDCGEWIQIDRPRKKTATKMIREMGWTASGDKHKCPKHRYQ